MMISTYCKHCKKPSDAITIDNVALCYKYAADMLGKNNNYLRAKLARAEIALEEMPCNCLDQNYCGVINFGPTICKRCKALAESRK